MRAILTLSRGPIFGLKSYLVFGIGLPLLKQQAKNSVCYIVFCVLQPNLLTMDHRGNTVQAFDQWQHPVASIEAWDVLH